MCTVTIVPTKGDDENPPRAIRMMCNRDESRQRAAALPPRRNDLGSRRALFPVDPDSGGTWIGVNDAGLVLTLLNANPGVMGGGRGGRVSGRMSRGRIIPGLLEADSFDQAYDWAGRLWAWDYGPFRLVLSDGKQLAEIASEGRSISRRREPLPGKPFMFTSSGLGDGVVEAPRRRLFEQWFENERRPWADQQESFHRHTWAGHGALSVCMARADARTVSRTTIELDLSTSQSVMTYQPLEADGAQAAASRVILTGPLKNPESESISDEPRA